MLIQADARSIPLRDGCVQMVVTSPPYFGLRDYGTARWEGGDPACDHMRALPPMTADAPGRRASTINDTQGSGTIRQAMANALYRDHCGKCGASRVDSQIGLEPSPDAYVATLVQVFREVRRVLKDDGVVWCNLGSSYLGGTPGSGGPSEKQLSNRGSRFDVGDRRSNQFPSRRRALAYDNDGTGLQGSTASDSSYFGLCDGCLADFLSHRERIAGNVQQTSQSGQPPTLTDRDTWQQDYAAASLGALPRDVQASTILQSWLQHRGECLHCDARSSALLAVRSLFRDALSCGDMASRTADNDVRGQISDDRSYTNSSGMAWVDYTSRLKQKDLVPIPWMVAMALQADGWYLRSDIIWAKPNPMPESVTDRPTKAHEYLFLLAKNERYYYNAAAIREPYATSTLTQFEKPYEGLGIKDYAAVGVQNPSDIKRRITDKQRGHGRRHAGFNDRWDAMPKVEQQMGGANKRTVWTIPTRPYSGAHFATMPEDLVEPCILAGSRLGDLVFDPFIGSGTVGAVAERLGRKWVGTDLNPAYHQLAKARTAQRGIPFTEAV